jgi:cytochrome oxidase Cu insertion factor (SCO1/SenC/PrrC family)
MSRLLGWTLAAVGAVAAIAGGSLLAAHQMTGGATVKATSTQAEGLYRGSEPPPGIRLPSFALRDVISRRVVRSADLRGRAVLVTFLDSDCTEQCPIIAGQIGRALQQMGAREASRVAPLAISVSPIIDTRASVKRFLREHRVLGRLEYLSGSVAALQPVWKEFGVLSAYETGDADTHSADVRVFDPQGVWVSTLHVGVDLTPANLAHDVRMALEKGA